ncbi:MAG: hypothetical protein RIK87_01775 [Fuerstiella sp.]
MLQLVLTWTISRALIVSSLAVPISLMVCRMAGTRSTRIRTLRRHPVLLAALVPLFMPDLLTGFTYRLTSARLIHSVVATELLYGGLLLCRVTALQLAVLLILPSSAISRQSIHSWKLLRTSGRPNWYRTWLRMLVLGPYRSVLVAWIGGMLLCFQEFETAALLQIDRHPVVWAVWLFDAHAAGEPLSVSLSFAARSLLFQLALLLPAILLLRVGGRRQVSLPPGAAADAGLFAGRPALDSASTGRGMVWAVRWLILCSLVVTFVWPVASNLTALAGGFRTLVAQGGLVARIRQIGFSLLDCMLVAGAALAIGRWLWRRSDSFLTVAVLLPGLCGSLVLSLILLAAFQLPVLNRVYDSWLPMLLGQTLWLLPRAFLLVAVLSVLTPQTSIHGAILLRATGSRLLVATARQLVFRLRNVRWLLAVGILTHWCFWDVTIVSVLRPVRFEPIVTRLYNEMHFGRTETLVALTCLSLLIPLTVFVVTGMIWKVVAVPGNVRHD